MNTARAAYQDVRRSLKAAGIPEPDAKARVIVSEALGVGLGDVLLPLPMSAAQRAVIDAMARRCAAGEPVEYVTGRAYFRYLTLAVTPDVLIPRQETELVAEEAIALIKARGYGTALDIGTGSGCIAISLATETGARVDACDISEAALALAQKNARASGVSVRFFLSDMLSSVTEAYDIIVSNPPYISDEEYRTLAAGVRDHEPRLALAAGVRDHEPRLALAAGDGLDYYRIIARDAGRHIKPGGALVLEIGATQAADVTALLADAGFTEITVKKDYAGRDRIVTARWK
jgi:release factor glutamine methyltransferase